jgi:hypothetical protein
MTSSSWRDGVVAIVGMSVLILGIARWDARICIVAAAFHFGLGAERWASRRKF